ncbi:YigZ family protein [Olivibacter ginsenosidimutans]|uniref:YigZ family protein n=1 Tax=Olivibacter ginsenosidimutans TaxID=1176537 RepID=A0ABP9BFA4_9SPHI
MNLFEDTYKTIEQATEGLYKDKGSKFIAYAYPFRDATDLKQVITEMKSLHPKARHHCWAYRLTTDRSIFRLNDDGEPSGTAGRPILNVLLSQDLTNIIVVVVRYFGGTLLGVPGLINAYKSATQDAINQANIITRTVNDVYEVHVEYPQLNELMRVVKDEELTLLEQHFDNECSLVFEIRQSRVNQTLGQLQRLENVKVKYLKSV